MPQYPTVLCHLVPRTVWESRPAPYVYSAPSCADEGFIHLSTLAQVCGTATRFYAERNDLLLLIIDTERLTLPVRWEDLYGHGEFPHLYGPLNLEAVVLVEPLPCHADGTFSLPHAVKTAYADSCH